MNEPPQIPDIVESLWCYQNLRTCEKAKLERRKKVNSAGVILHCLQCQTCGRNTGIGVKRDHTDPPLLDESKWNAEREKVAAERAAEFEAVREGNRARYSEYLRSERWQQLRAKILQRDRICQGCLSAPVHDVHHLTYDHKYNELAFELIGLCRDCHKKIHGIDAEDSQ